jgi:deoxycytidine triphosphate deaminase
MNESTQAGIFSDERILASLGDLMIGADPGLVQPCSYDLRIGVIFDKGRIVSEANAQMVVEPGAIVSVLTQEELKLPSNVVAHASAINRLSSQGILVLNTGLVDPGYRGSLSVRLLNLRRTPRVLSVGDPIMTITFEELPEPVKKPYASNRDRVTMIREHNATDAEQNPHSLLRLIEYGPHAPVVSEQRVNQLIMRHWLSWVVGVASFVAAVASVIAVVQGFHKDTVSTSPPPRENLTTSPPPSNGFLASPRSSDRQPASAVPIR